MSLEDLPNINPDAFHQIRRDLLALTDEADHAPRILILYGSLRKSSYSRFMAEEAGRVLKAFGAEVRTFERFA